jgi:hypothetical protein
MTAIVLPDIDRSTIEELRKKIPNLSEIELPQLPKIDELSKTAGKTADQTIDRLLGRKRTPVWPWVAAGVGLIAVLGMIAAYIAWFRRPTWEASTDTWSSEPTTPSGIGMTSSTTATDELSDSAPAGTGLTAAESSLASNPYPIEEA